MRNENQFKIKSGLIILAVITSLVFFNYWGFLSWPKNLAYWITAPFLRFFQAVDHVMTETVSFIMTVKDLSRENSDLSSENQRLWRENSQLKEAASENATLRQRLSLSPLADYRLVMADVIGYNQGVGQYFLINKGSQDGLKTGQAAVDANNFLVGRLSEVSANFAKIILITDGQSILNVISQDTRVRAIIKGRYGLGLAMEMIPVNVVVNSGETILTSGINDSTPSGLIVGRIGKITKKENDLFQQADIIPAVNFSRLEKVFVLIQ
jgi:rod shape-determining protein MreC